MVEVLEAVFLGAAWLISLIWGLLIVARRAGKLGVRFWTKWLLSEDAEPYMDRMAERVMVRFEPRLTEFEERLSEPVHVDLVPIVGMVTEQVVPRVREEVASIRASLDGRIGYIKKLGKGVGEAAAEVLGEEALAQAGVRPDNPDDALRLKLLALAQDKEWVKEHPAAAFGLSLFGQELGSRSSGGRSSSGYVRRGRRT